MEREVVDPNARGRYTFSPKVYLCIYPVGDAALGKERVKRGVYLLGVFPISFIFFGLS